MARDMAPLHRIAQAVRSIFAMLARAFGAMLGGVFVEQIALAIAAHAAHRFHALLPTHETAVSAAAAMAAILGAPWVFDRGRRLRRACERQHSHHGQKVQSYNHLSSLCLRACLTGRSAGPS